MVCQKKAYKAAFVADKILEIYKTRFAMWRYAALIFPEEELTASLPQLSDDSQMEDISGSQSDKKTKIQLLKAALEHLLEHFGEKYDCWFRPPYPCSNLKVTIYCNKN